MKFARWVFLIAGIYGILVLSPMYFLADKFGEQDPPVITHREYYYGFIGVGIAFQVLFLLIAREPLRLRPAIIAFPLTARSDAEITLLTNLITLTPGTLSLDVSADRARLYVHALSLKSRESLISDIANGFEKKVVDVFR